MKKRVVSVICMMSLLLSAFAPILPVRASAENLELIEASDIPLRLHYDEEAPYGNEGTEDSSGITADDGWERWSLPLGNGYFGANVFGRTMTERIQLTEKTLSNPYYRVNPNTGVNENIGGVNNFSETYIDIGHPFEDVTDYSRWLDLNTAISGVSYSYEGVTYTREVFTSYPDKALVIRLDASEDGKLSFVLRPTVPWQQEYAAWEGDGAFKTGEVISYLDGNDGIVELFGKLGYYDVDFLGMYRVVTDGGTVSATTCINEYGNTDGTITVTGAKSAYIYVTLGTDYELSSEMFLTDDKNKPTFNTTLDDTRVKVEGEFNAIAAQLEGKSFEDAYAVLKNNHLNDYQSLFSRVSLNLGDLEDAELTTDALLDKYNNEEYSHYLEALYFQYGRYLLIASSRPGTLVANLQGTWSRYNKAPWGSGIWHNINVQMNYWPAFSTNIAETFDAYVEYNAAYMAAAEKYATDNVKRYNNEQLGADGGNGWCIGTGAFPYYIAGSRSAGNLGFTTQLYWEYYEYTQDRQLLEEVVFPILVSAARYIVKTVELTDDGKYLVSYCDSPEVHVNGVWYYTTGTTYAQSFAYQNNYNALLAAKELGIDLTDSDLLDTQELCVFKRLMEQLDKYDPIIVGLSGQVKEFREEDYYSSVGDDPNHRHISQLVGLYPGNIINSTTPAWLDAAKVTLTARGDNATGWGIAHRLNLWARTKDGDRTYKLLNSLLDKKKTATNLWDLHPPFQIDGNLGGTAGISEMLLQSHEGYIEPLAAIPSAWDSGSYTGLVARGNFEVSAAWENGVAKTFNIKSLSGNTASVSYGGITSATVVRASDGKAVKYTVSGTDLITFETEVGETYIIAGFKLSTKLPAPKTMTIDRAGLGEINLSWDAVEGAVAYRLYVAIESQPDYTLVETTTATSAVYIPKSGNINARMTFKVVPVNADGVEGKGALVYQNPIEVESELAGYEAYAFENGELQVTLKTTENTQKYRLWKMAEGESEYTLVTESIYPIIIYNGYVETDKYAVSLISDALRTESELFELASIRQASAGAEDDAAVWVDNVLLGKTVTKGSEATPTFNNNNTYGYYKLTDGLFNRDADGNSNIHTGRFSTHSGENTCLDGVIELGDTYLLSELRIYDFSTSQGTSRIGDDITIKARVNGVWQTVATISGSDNIAAAKKRDNEYSLYYLPINLMGVQADAIEVICHDGTRTDGITAYEITCSGALLPANAGGGPAEENILLGNKVTSGSAATAVFGSGYGYAKLTDGLYDKDADGKTNIHAGRFSTTGIVNSCMDAVMELTGEYALYDLRIYDFSGSKTTARIGDTITVKARIDGEWKTVATLSGTDAVTAAKALDNDKGLYYASINLGGIKADAIEVICHESTRTDGVTAYEITCSGTPMFESVGGEAEEENILLGKTFTGDQNPLASQYGYQTLTDGDYGLHTGRFALKDVIYSKVTLVCDLEDVYALYDLAIYDHVDTNALTRCRETTIEVYYKGEWTTLVDAQPLASGSDRLTGVSGKGYTQFNLGGVKAEKIRITCYNSSGETKGISLYEILCSGTKLGEDRNNLLAGSASATINGNAMTTGQLASITDSNSETSLSVNGGSSYYLEFDLGQNYGINTISIRDVKAATDLVGGALATRSNDTYIELYISGEWVRVVNGASLSTTDAFTTFELYGLQASKIRIGFNNTQTFDDGTSPAVVISEIECAISNTAADKKPLLEAYASLPVLNDGDATYVANMKKFREYVTEFLLSDAKVAKYAEMINAYSATLLGGTHTAHTLVSHATKAPTCTENGYFAYEECTNCDYTTYESILRTGHEVEDEWSCSEEAHYKKCTVCGEPDASTYALHSFDNACDTLCEECGYTRSITHDYSVTDCNGTHHWQKCSVCGAIDESSVQEHVFENAADRECDCGYDREHIHVYDVTKFDENNHWLACFCGEMDESTVAPHEFTNACDTTCACGYERTITHDYTVVKSNEFNHWTECSVCGTVDENSVYKHTGGTATCINKAVCETCNAEYGKLDGTNHDTTGVTDWAKDSSGHWQVCNCGEKFNQSKHNTSEWISTNNVHYMECDVCGRTFEDGVCRGGEATCTERAVCKVCNNPYGELGEHKYDSTWKCDENQHWHECECGEKSDVSEHAFGEVIDGEQMCECGYRIVAPEEAPVGFFARIIAWFESIIAWFKNLFS